jgi:multidrug transporter EmrE-like cation transporter
LSTLTVTTAPSPAKSGRSRRALILVALCTVSGAAAQLLMKIGASSMAAPDLPSAILQAIRNVPLLFGYILYGMNAALLALALREGELSLIYPVIALTYVWVTILSVMVFKEVLNPYKIVGLSIIVLGVAVLGRSGSK